MFVQVIKGQVSDAADVQAAWNRWLDEMASDAIGWLGTTAGVTDDGTFVALARFESEEAARRNSERSAQDHAGVVHQDVDAPKPAQYRARQSLHVVVLSHIAVDGQHIPAERDELRLRLG